MSSSVTAESDDDVCVDCHHGWCSCDVFVDDEQTSAVPDDATKQLWVAYADGRTAEVRNELVNYYLPLVERTVSKLSVVPGGAFDRDDLIASGMMGLIDAIEKFNPTMNVPFPAYAVTRIRGAALDEIRRWEWAPRSLQDDRKRVSEAKHAYQQQHHRVATEQEIANSTGLPVERVRVALQQQRSVSLEEVDIPVASDVGELFTSELVDNIHNLDYPLNVIIALRYYGKLTVNDISTILSLSASRVSQLHNTAIAILKDADNVVS